MRAPRWVLQRVQRCGRTAMGAAQRGGSALVAPRGCHAGGARRWAQPCGCTMMGAAPWVHSGACNAVGALQWLHHDGCAAAVPCARGRLRCRGRTPLPQPDPPPRHHHPAPRGSGQPTQQGSAQNQAGKGGTEIQPAEDPPSCERGAVPQPCSWGGAQHGPHLQQQPLERSGSRGAEGRCFPPR